MEVQPRHARGALQRRLEELLTFSSQALRRTMETWTPDKPAPVHTRDGRWYRPPELWTDWTPGFYAGQMWILHGLTGDADWRRDAERYSEKLRHRRFDRDVHDLGFIFLSTYRRWHDLTSADDPRRELLRDVLVTAATVQSYRWNGAGEHGFIYSFNGPQSLFIDVMMNVRLLFWAGEHGAPGEVRRRAIQHCRTSARFLVRRDGAELGQVDGSTAHEAIFNTEPGRGEFRCLSTQQGYSPFTCWSRGLAWALYGFAVAYEATKEPEFLATAERCARYYIAQTPADGVPFWDYGAPEIPAEPRDSSAAAIASVGFHRLAAVSDDPARAAEYRGVAIRILETLLEPGYLAEGSGQEGLLLQGVYHKPRGWGVDAAVMWGDYFFLEAVESALAAIQRPG